MGYLAYPIDFHTTPVSVLMRTVITVKCKYCATQTDTISELRSHFFRDHQTELQAIQRWLDDTTSHKLQVAELLAAEGMKGHRAT